MELKRALEILELHQNECNEHTIKKNYRLKALKYHPDKSGRDTIKEFQEIQEAYEYLMDKKGSINNDYESIFTDFLHSINDNGILNSIFNKLQEKCYDNLFEYIKNKSLVDIIQIKTILCNYKQVLHFPDNLLYTLDNIIHNKKSNMNCYILNPCLDDLLVGNVYKLKFDNQEMYVPLWHTILEHDDNIITVCELEETNHGYHIDEYKNIHINQTYNINHLLCHEKITKQITSNYSITFDPSELNIKKEQLFIIKNKGIPYPDKQHIYSDAHRSNIIMHITIET
jgi:DnaJ-class molecular chaperone